MLVPLRSLAAYVFLFLRWLSITCILFWLLIKLNDERNWKGWIGNSGILFSSKLFIFTASNKCIGSRWFLIWKLRSKNHLARDSSEELCAFYMLKVRVLFMPPQLESITLNQYTLNLVELVQVKPTTSWRNGVHEQKWSKLSGEENSLELYS